MQIHTDRFETTLPKGRFFTPPVRPPTPPKPPLPLQQRWQLALAAFIAGGALVAICLHPKPEDPRVHEVPAPVAPVQRATPIPTIPTLRQLPIQPLDPVTPRAKLVHVRPIGSIMRVQMPDGSVLTTRYMGELASPGNLPRSGGQMGDEWFTRSDSHCWVLGTLPGTVTTGWIDP